MNTEIQLASAWLLWMTPLPLLIYGFMPAFTMEKPSVRVPWFTRMVELSGRSAHKQGVVNRVKWWEWLFIWMIWLCAVLALSRPQILYPPVVHEQPARDLMLLVDLSGSMDTQDFTNKTGERVDRLTAVKEVLGEFLGQRQGDRVGLTVFGNAAFVQVPFTQDLAVTRQLLNETAVRMAGPRTAFGDAIGLAITLFEQSQVEQKVIIALTDGNDTGSQIPPEQAAKIAAEHDILIHVVGVGDPQSIGEEALDEVTLNTVAEVTGGRYFFAEDHGALAEIYRELDKLNPREVDTRQYRPREDVFHWPLAAAFGLSLLQHIFSLVLTRHKNEKTNNLVGVDAVYHQEVDDEVKAALKTEVNGG